MKLFTPRRLARSVGTSVLALSMPATLCEVAGAAGVTKLTTTNSVLMAAKAAIAAQTGVHLVLSTSPSPTSVVEHVTADLGKAVGTETISAGTETVVIKVTAAYAYLSGSSSGLTKIVGLSAAEVKKVGKKWVSVKAGSSQYTDVAGSMTLSAVAGVLPAAKGTTLYGPSASAKHLYTLKWQTAATSSEPKLTDTLTLSAVGATLPVEETTTTSGGGHETLVLSRWDEHVKVTPPPAGSTVALSKLSG